MPEEQEVGKETYQSPATCSTHCHLRLLILDLRNRLSILSLSVVSDPPLVLSLKALSCPLRALKLMVLPYQTKLADLSKARLVLSLLVWLFQS